MMSPLASFTELDHQMMAKAIKLAAKGRFTSSPNPNVGCIIVQNIRCESGELKSSIIGQGFHLKAGLAHAEINALQDAAARGFSVEGATCYVTLEPCSHFGRTPPCALALIAAGLGRVVIAMQDPNPQVAGRGITLLKEAGIEVALGLLQSDAERLNLGFIQRMQGLGPRVTLKLAASLDAKTALANGHSQWITGVFARRDVQLFRAQSCAILTGADTVLVDNPSLNVRWQELGSVQELYPEASLRQPLRIIIDSQNRISAQCHLLSLPGKVLIARQHITGEFAEYGEQVSELKVALNAAGKLDLRLLLMALANMGINDLWVEAGATLAGALIEAKLVTRLVVYMAPKIMGADGQSLIGLSGLTQMQQVQHWHWQDLRKIGDDIRLILEPIQE